MGVSIGRVSAGEGPAHYIVCGADSTAVRVVEELRRFDEPVTVILPDPDTDRAREMEATGAVLVVASRPHEGALVEAGVETAQALALVEPDDVRNVYTALTAEELNPRLRLVVHIVDQRLASYLDDLIDNCTPLSTAAIAAPEFVSAALGETGVRWISVGGRDIVAGPAQQIADPPIVTLANTAAVGGTALLPNGTGDLVLGSGLRHPPRRRRKRLDDLRADIARIFDRRLRLVAVALAAFVAVGTVLIRVVPSGVLPTDDGTTEWDRWLAALYIAVWTVTGVGFDEEAVSHTDVNFRLLGLGGGLLGLVLVSLLTAAIVDAFIGASLARSLGRIRGRPRGHFVVAGLGSVGAEVAKRLHERGYSVVAIERDADKPGVQTAHGLGIPVIIGNVGNDQILYEAGLSRCRALVAVTNDDVANLQAGLNAREHNPDARIVLRLFDHELARKVQTRLALGTSRSVSAIAAPGFAHTLLRRRIDATVPAGRRVLLVSELVVEAGSPADGARLDALAEAEPARLLARHRPQQPWDWSCPQDTELGAGDQVAVVASAAGLAKVLRATRVELSG